MNEDLLDPRQIDIRAGARVCHAVHGEGLVVHVERSKHELLGFLRVHVLFDGSTDPNFWLADDELEVLSYSVPPETVAAT